MYVARNSDLHACAWEDVTPRCHDSGLACADHALSGAAICYAVHIHSEASAGNNPVIDVDRCTTDRQRLPCMNMACSADTSLTLPYCVT